METTQPPTVYVVQSSPGKDLMPAKEFGKLHVLLTPADTKGHIDRVIDKLQHGLSCIAPQDYVLLIGDPVAIGITMHIALHNAGGIIRVLRWKRESYEYEAITVGVVQ